MPISLSESGIAQNSGHEITTGDGSLSRHPGRSVEIPGRSIPDGKQRVGQGRRQTALRLSNEFSLPGCTGSGIGPLEMLLLVGDLSFEFFVFRRFAAKRGRRRGRSRRSGRRRATLCDADHRAGRRRIGRRNRNLRDLRDITHLKLNPTKRTAKADFTDVSDVQGRSKPRLRRWQQAIEPDPRWGHKPDRYQLKGAAGWSRGQCRAKGSPGSSCDTESGVPIFFLPFCKRGVFSQICGDQVAHQGNCRRENRKNESSGSALFPAVARWLSRLPFLIEKSEPREAAASSQVKPPRED